MTQVPLLPITFGRANGQPSDMHPRHRHDVANLAIVLSGGYLQAGDYGRRRVVAGDVLIHDAFEAHLNRFSTGRTEVLSLPLPLNHGLPIRGTVCDADMVVRLARHDPSQAISLVLDTFVPSPGREEDWPDLLASGLAEAPYLCLRSWADEHGLRPGSLSRGFRLTYGTSPRRYRSEWRARNAWSAILKVDRPLAEIAAEYGFADQSHMNRAVVELTGSPPGAWRRRVKWVQDGDFAGP
jgi:AraC-like DNA-binding protein